MSDHRETAAESHDPILPSVNSPEDLKKVKIKDLPRLAEEIRAEIIRTVSKTGGHLASNLGAVELTIALLYVFDPPADKILFDVSHQCYTYKLLTGRKDRFGTLRQTGGLSGFQKRSESTYDAFGSGHAGNSLSAALGLAAARDRLGGDEEVISVIGDASIANGVSLEALNNVRDTTRRFLIVLNDNRMSISRPTGALARVFGRMLSSPRYNRFKTSAERFGVERLKMSWLREHYHAFESRLKSLFLGRNNTVFETLGIRYVGPVDGHDVTQLVAAFRAIKNAKLPTVLHVRTIKGHGFRPAERDPTKWHGCSPFELDADGNLVEKPHSDTTIPTNVAWSKAFGNSLTELARKDSRIFALTAAMADGTGLNDFAKEFPERFRDVGICEEHELTFAAGLAAGSMRPVAAVYSTFFQRAVDGLIHDIALQDLPVIIALDRAGAVPADGATHHGIFDIALLSAIPGITIFQARTVADLRRFMRTALTLPGPVAIRYPRGSAPDNSADDHGEMLEVGKAQILECTGDNAQVAVWTLGPEDAYARELCTALKSRGVNSVHVDARFVKPLDEKLIARQIDSGVKVFFSLEDATASGGLGDAIRRAVMNRTSGARTIAFGWPQEFPQHASSRSDLMAQFGITPSDATIAILKALDIN